MKAIFKPIFSTIFIDFDLFYFGFVFIANIKWLSGLMDRTHDVHARIPGLIPCLGSFLVHDIKKRILS